MNPRVGIVSANSLQSFVFEDIDAGIDITFEEFLLELSEEGIEEDSDEWQERTDHYEGDSRTVLFGDWQKDAEGKYEPNTQGTHGFAATFSSYSNNVSVEWSKTTKLCNHTSPCYVMADGSGPCGDLDTPGDSVTAYSLPEDYFGSESD